jgi:hypothetical protein
MSVHFVMLPMDGSEGQVAVNPELVRCVQSRDRQAEIWFDNDLSVIVDKSLEQVVRDLEIAGR